MNQQPPVYQQPPPGGYQPPPPGAVLPPPVYQQPAQYDPNSMPLSPRQQAPVVVMAAQQHRPPNNFVLSLLVCLCCNHFCLGLAALYNSHQSNEAADNGNMDGARRYGESAKKLSIAAIIIGCIVGVCVIVWWIVAAALVANADTTYRDACPYNYWSCNTYPYTYCCFRDW